LPFGLPFEYDSVTYQYIGLPFGLRSAPRLFYEAMRVHDDVLILCDDADLLRSSIPRIVAFWQSLGWTLRAKLHFEPST
jgi:hypothetical protein